MSHSRKSKQPIPTCNKHWKVYKHNFVRSPTHPLTYELVHISMKSRNYNTGTTFKKAKMGTLSITSCTTYIESSDERNHSSESYRTSYYSEMDTENHNMGTNVQEVEIGVVDITSSTTFIKSSDKGAFRNNRDGRAFSPVFAQVHIHRAEQAHAGNDNNVPPQATDTDKAHDRFEAPKGFLATLFDCVSAWFGYGHKNQGDGATDAFQNNDGGNDNSIWCVLVHI
ncbi:hypothetical protein V5O48_015177 [Marasmius crinis-equi]|uniref:Uncharacterized protein n=1 Tax=Marasmius crinis-equi TaxID=585013 RepID=A0ABR3EV89_9AGAR